MSEANTNPVHPFEAAGLGKAPFRYVGYQVQELGTDGLRKIGEAGGVDIHTKAGGTCEYCGMAIVNLFNVVSSDGKKFHVGSDCIEKACGPKLVAAVKRDARKIATEKRHAREAARIANAKSMLDSVRHILAARNHPNEKLAAKGKTLADWVDWMFANAGNAGKIEAAKMVEACIE